MTRLRTKETIAQYIYTAFIKHIYNRPRLLTVYNSSVRNSSLCHIFLFSLLTPALLSFHDETSELPPYLSLLIRCRPSFEWRSSEACVRWRCLLLLLLTRRSQLTPRSLGESCRRGSAFVCSLNPWRSNSVNSSIYSSQRQSEIDLFVRALVRFYAQSLSRVTMLCACVCVCVDVPAYLFSSAVWLSQPLHQFFSAMTIQEFLKARKERRLLDFVGKLFWNSA